MTDTAERTPGNGHLLAWVCVPLLLLAGVLSFYRFVVARDYIVEYEGECDPAAESCFVACEDEECNDVYYYAIVEKHAAELYASCGADITDCAEASVCLSTDQDCHVTYCDPALISEGEACVALEKAEAPAEEDAEESAGEEPLEEENAVMPEPV